jgi:hypothetical protein
MISRALSARRNVFDISLGHVWSVRGDAQINKTRDAASGDCWRFCASMIACRAASHSTDSSYSGSAKPVPALRVRGDLRASSYASHAISAIASSSIFFDANAGS